MYSLEAYGKMMSDGIRTNAYIAALRATVSPGSVVVDLGCGTGIFALHACRLGARKVYAIESSDCIQIARDLAAANGLSDRIEFLQEISTRVTLPERADVIVADLRGILPYFGASLSSMIDARERFLAPGGAIIPKCDRLWAVLIEAPATYSRCVLPWAAAMQPFEISPIREMAANNIYKIRTHPEEYLAEPCQIASIDYASVASPACAADARWTVSRHGIAHGMAIWFDAELALGAGFSNAPDGPEVLYGAAFFPFREPFAVTAGDQCWVQVHAHPVGDDYIWRWNVFLNGTPLSQQSTFFGMAVSAKSLRSAPTQPEASA